MRAVAGIGRPSIHIHERVVMQELAAGARTPKQARELKRLVFTPFERRDRVFAPSADAFVKSGRMLADVAGRDGWEVIKDGDFDRFVPFLGGWRHVAPWP